MNETDNVAELSNSFVIYHLLLSIIEKSMGAAILVFGVSIFGVFGILLVLPFMYPYIYQIYNHMTSKKEIYSSNDSLRFLFYNVCIEKGIKIDDCTIAVFDMDSAARISVSRDGCRVELSQNLVDSCKDEEIKSAIQHELGHLKNRGEFKILKEGVSLIPLAVFIGGYFYGISLPMLFLSILFSQIVSELSYNHIKRIGEKRADEEVKEELRNDFINVLVKKKEYIYSNDRISNICRRLLEVHPSTQERASRLINEKIETDEIKRPSLEDKLYILINSSFFIFVSSLWLLRVSNYSKYVLIVSIFTFIISASIFTYRNSVGIKEFLKNIVLIILKISSEIFPKIWKGLFISTK